MLSFTESVTIGARPKVIWGYLVDLEHWWVASNPEHIWLEIQSADKSVAQGTEIHFEERVAGVRATAEGRIVSLHPEVEATWEGEAVYRYLGFRIPIQEGVKWRLAGMSGDLTIVSVSVWAEFPKGLFGGLMEWHAKKHLDVEERDREHTRRELNYLKEVVEGDDAEPTVSHPLRIAG